METVVSVFINDIRSVERNFFVWIDAHQEGRDWCLQNLSDLKQYFRLLSQWLRVWLKPNTFCFRSTDLYIMLETTVVSEHQNTSILLRVLWITHRATVRCHCDIYIDLVSFEARVQVVHQGLLGHRLQAAQVVHAELAVAGGRSTGPTRTSRFWNRKCISDLFQMQNMCHFISDAKVWVWKVWIFGRQWRRREWWCQLELGSHFLKLNLQGTMVFTCQHQFLLCLIFHCFIFPLARA